MNSVMMEAVIFISCFISPPALRFFHYGLWDIYLELDAAKILAHFKDVLKCVCFICLEISVTSVE